MLNNEIVYFFKRPFQTAVIMWMRFYAKSAWTAYSAYAWPTLVITHWFIQNKILLMVRWDRSYQFMGLTSMIVWQELVLVPFQPLLITDIRLFLSTIMIHIFFFWQLQIRTQRGRAVPRAHNAFPWKQIKFEVEQDILPNDSSNLHKKCILWVVLLWWLVIYEKKIIK